MPTISNYFNLGHQGMRVAANSGWLLLNRSFTSLLGVLVAALLARGLGPEKYGLWGMAQAYCGLFASLSGTALSSLVVRELVRRPKEEALIMGSALALRLVLVLAGGLVALGGLFWPGLDGRALAPLVLLLLLAWLPGALLGVIGARLQSRLEHRIAFKASALSITADALAKLLAVLKGAPLWGFAAISASSQALMALLISLLQPGGWAGLLGWRFSARIARAMWREGWPLILWVVTTTIYNSIDQLMLGSMQGRAAAGEYIAAVRLARFWTFLPGLLTPSLVPYLVRLREDSPGLYLHRLDQVYWLFTWSGLLLAAALSWLAPVLVKLVYGQRYLAGGSIMAITVWGNVLLFQGMARGVWIVNEGLQRHALAFSAAGALANVTLNYFLIPRWGGEGAALGTLISQALAILVFSSFFAPTRVSSLMLLRAYLPWRPDLLRPWRPEEEAPEQPANRTRR